MIQNDRNRKSASDQHLPLPSQGERESRNNNKVYATMSRDRDTLRWDMNRNRPSRYSSNNERYDDQVKSFRMSRYLTLVDSSLAGSSVQWSANAPATTSTTSPQYLHQHQETPLRFPSLGQDDQPVFQNPPPIYRKPNSDDSLTLLLPLLILLSTLLFMLLLFIIMIIVVRKRSRISLTDSNSPIDVGREQDLESTNSTSHMAGGMAGGISGIEERWLETIPQSTRSGYLRSRDFLISNPPNSSNTDITLQQYLSIQEKGVSAWSFEPDYENNPSVWVENRTEITFLADGAGMTPEEGGGCNVQSNLPLPKLNEVYYWEAKMFTLPEGSNVSVGLATKPFPSFRLPGWSKYSIGYFSQDGFKCHNYPFFSQSYGPAYIQGDVIGCGYRPRTGTVFFTRNGKKLEDAYIGLNRYNLFPTIGSNNSSEIHINLGQAGFVFIEANVKKWGLAPMVGTRAPPPAYGMERGSVLIEASRNNRVLQERREREERENRFFPISSDRAEENLVDVDVEQQMPQPPPITDQVDEDLIGNGMEVNRSQELVREIARGSERRYGDLNRALRNQGRHRLGSENTNAPSRSSPLRRSVTRINTEGDLSERGSSSAEEDVDAEAATIESQEDEVVSDQDQDRDQEDGNQSPRPRAMSSASSSEGQVNNPPTPGRLDISLHNLDSNGHHQSSSSSSNRTSTHSNRTIRATGENGSYFPSTSSSSSSSTSRNNNALGRSGSRIGRSNSPQPPSYDSLAQDREREISRNNSAGNGVREFANSLISLLGERGLLAPLGANNTTSDPSPNSDISHVGSSHSTGRDRNGEEPPSFDRVTTNRSLSDDLLGNYEANSSQNIQIENDLDQSTRENTARNRNGRGDGRGNASWTDWARGLTGRG